MTPRQEAIIEMIVGGHTHAAVADLLDISTKTVQRELAESGVRAALNQALRDQYNQLLGGLLLSAHAATATLSAEQSGDRPADRIRAATAVVSLAVRAAHTGSAADTTSRLRQVEADNADLRIRLHGLEERTSGLPARPQPHPAP